MSREGAQIEERAEKGESVALALDNQQVHDPKSDKADPTERDCFRLNALLLSAAADEGKADTRQLSIARAPLEAGPPADDNEAAWFLKVAFGGL